MLQSSSVSVVLDLHDALVAGGLATAVLDLQKAIRVSFTNGAGAGQADRVFAGTRTLAGAASEDLDLSGTMLVDAFGRALALARVKMALFVAPASNPRDITIGAAASNAFLGPLGSSTDTTKLVPGGVVLWLAPTAAGFPVTAATADLLKVANGAGAGNVSYDLYLLGSTT